MRRGNISHFPALQSLTWTGGQVANMEGWASARHSPVLVGLHLCTRSRNAPSLVFVQVQVVRLLATEELDFWLSLAVFYFFFRYILHSNTDSDADYHSNGRSFEAFGSALTLLF